MRETAFIKGGPVGARRELGIGGKSLHSLYRQIHALIARELGQDAADFLAMPVPDPSGARIDWYAQGDGVQIVALDTLDPAEKGKMADTINDLVKSYAALARRHTSAQDAAEREIGAALELVAAMPLFDDVFVSDGRPVAIFWSFTPEDPSDRIVSDGKWDLARAASPKRLSPADPEPDTQAAPQPNGGNGTKPLSQQGGGGSGGTVQPVPTVLRWVHSQFASLHLEGGTALLAVVIAGVLLLLCAATAAFAAHQRYVEGAAARAALASLQSEYVDMQEEDALLRLATRRQRDRLCRTPPASGGAP